MSYYPQNATGLNYITYPSGPTAQGTAVAASSSPNTKGAYVEFVASSPFTCNLIHLELTGFTTAGIRYLLDIATGGSGSETVIIPDILLDGSGSTSQCASVLSLPVTISAGTRIALRCQASTGSAALNITITLVAAGGIAGASAITTYGATTADSGGIAIDPGGTANTKGAYTQITASTSAVAQWIMLCASLGGQNAGAAGFCWCLDIATGGAGSEVVLIPDLRVRASGLNSTTLSPNAIGVLTYIPAGTRLAVRASCSSNAATQRLLDVTLMTAVAPSEPGGGTVGYAFA